MILSVASRQPHAHGQQPDASAVLVVGSLERRLVPIVLAALLPLVLVAIYILYDTAQRQHHHLIEATQNRAVALMGAVDAELTGVIASLDTFAAGPPQADAAALHEEALRLVARRGAGTTPCCWTDAGSR